MMQPAFNSILWVIATLGIALTPQLPRMPLPVAILAIAPIIWKILAELKAWNPLHSLVRYALTGLSLTMIFVLHGGVFGRRASVTLLAAMLTLKLLECERIRDARLIVSFSFFLCATQFLFAQGILMPIYGIATVITGLVALAQLQRNEAFDPVGETPHIQASLFSELAFSMRLLLLAAPVCLAFFVFFPRWASPLWGVPETTLDAKTGLGDSMSPGSIQNLFMDDSPAFRVEFQGDTPAAGDLYWRGPVFWNYDGKKWSSSFYGRNIAAEDIPDGDTAEWSYTVQLEPNERRWLFALDYPTQAPQNTRISMDYQLLRRQPVLQLLQYQMSSNSNHVDTPELNLTMTTIALDLPEGFNPETREMMTRWRTETPDDRELIQRVLNHFNQQEFHYSLEAPLLGQNAIDEFLFDSRTGYCEHYASAFAVMMRMANIPTRVVTGYLGGWYSDLGSYMLIRQSDAHAWTEVWLPDNGWTRIDPTSAVSPLRVQQGSLGALSDPRHMLDFDWVRNVRNGFDLLEQRWNDWVVEYGAKQQSRLFSAFGLDQLSPAGLVAALSVILGIIALFLLPVILRTAGPEKKDPIKQAWQKFLNRLKKAGFVHSPSDGAMELATAASIHLPADSVDIFHIAELYNLHRYSPEPPDLDQIQLAVREFRPKKTVN
jgi:transglutaminase-like putative cysteine protease